MPNVVLTLTCNRTCPYCFASADGAREYLDRSDFDVILRYHELAHLKTVRLMGGEPSLHPEFTEIVAAAVERGFRVKLFSNGLMPARAREYLSRLPPSMVDLVVNVNSPQDSLPNEYQALDATLASLAVHTSLAHTIYHPSWEAGFLVDLINRFRLRPRLRLGLAHPNAEHSNKYVAPGDYRAVAAQLVKLTERTDRDDIAVDLDCGFIQCMFTQSDLGRLVERGVKLDFGCRPSVDIGPRLATWHCYPLSKSERVVLTEFANLRSLHAHYLRVFHTRRTAGIHADCGSCRYRRRGQCSGGCLAHASQLASINVRDTAV